MLPAHQGFGPEQLAVEVDLGLVMEKEFAALQARAHLPLQCCAGVDARLHLRVEEAQGIAPAALGFVHGQVGALEQFLDITLGVGKQRHANAGGAVVRLAGQFVGRSQAAQHFAGHRLDFANDQLWLARQAFEEQDKFIAAEACQGVAGTALFAQAFADLLQQLVAKGMAEGVVDVLEMVQVDKQQGAFLAFAPVAGQGLVQAIEQQAAVGQASERVIEGQLMNLFEVFLVLADIGGNPAQGVDRAVRVAQRDLYRKKGLRRAAVDAAIDLLGFHPLASLQHQAIVFLQIGHGLGIEEGGIGLADHKRLRLAEQLADLAIGVLITQLVILDVDKRIDAVEDGVQALFFVEDVLGLRCHPPAQPQVAGHGQQQECAQRRQAPPQCYGDAPWQRLAAPAFENLVIRRVIVGLQVQQLFVDGGQQVGIAALAAGEKQPRRLEHDGGVAQAEARGLKVAKTLVGHRRIGTAASHQGKAVEQAVLRQQLGLDAEAVEQVFQVLLLHRAL